MSDSDSNLANKIVGAGKAPTDPSQPTDTIVVLPAGELSAIIDALYYVLEHTTSDTFALGVRKHILSALKRLE